MRLPKGSIFLCVILAVCVLTMAAGAGGNGGPGLFDEGNMTRMQNRTRMDAGNSSMPFNDTFAFPGNGTGPGPARVQAEAENTVQKSPVDELFRALENFLKGFS